MAFRRKRRKFNGIWLPTAGIDGWSLSIPEDGDFAGTPVSFNIVDGNIPWNENTTFAAGILGSSSFANYPGGLAVASRMGFLSKRIVGQVFVSVPTKSTTTVATVLVAAGIFVDRADNDGNFQNIRAWNPLESATSQKRWLWQRSWMLQNPAYDSSTDGVPDYPHTNVEYGDIRSGCHIDVKTKARVAYEEQLRFTVQGIAVTQVGSPAEGSLQIEGHCHLRCFGVPIAGGQR